MCEFIVLKKAGDEWPCPLDWPLSLPQAAIRYHPQAHLATDVLVDEHVLALVVEDNVNLLGPRATDVRA